MHMSKPSAELSESPWTPAETAVWVERARALEPLIDEYRDQAEEERRLPRVLFDAMIEGGFHRMCVPRRFGGEQVSPTTMMEVAEVLARMDGGIAWNAAIYADGGLMSEYIDPEGARAIYGAGDSVVAGSSVPMGSARRVSGGYEIGGRWPFGSGSHHANWMILAGFVEPDDEAFTRVARGFIAPASSCHIIEGSWDTLGLRGSGSNDFEAEGVFVAPEYSYLVQHILLGAEGPDVVYSRGFQDVVGPQLAAISTGIALHALDEFKALATKKTPGGSHGTLSTRPSVHDQIGRLEAQLGAARAYLRESVAEVEKSIALGERGPDDATGILSRSARAHAVQVAVDVVTTVHLLAGGTSIYKRSPLERCLRDVHTASHHIAISWQHFESAGAAVLGESSAFAGGDRSRG